MRTQLFIDGAFRDAVSGETFVSEDPARGTEIARVAKGGTDDVQQAVAAARTAFDEGPWPRMGAAERAEALRLIADGLEAHDGLAGPRALHR